MAAMLVLAETLAEMSSVQATTKDVALSKSTVFLDLAHLLLCVFLRWTTLVLGVSPWLTHPVGPCNSAALPRILSALHPTSAT